MSPYDWLNLSLQTLSLVVTIIMLMINWPALKRERRKPK